jgi:hypothetical protein
MAVYSQTFTCGLTTDALFRVWGKFISDSLTAGGWAKTADTGQIDWSTVAKPGAATTVAGYEIRLSNDAFTDIYMKIEYGSGYSATTPGMWITTGTGSNGSGTLTGTVSTRFTPYTAMGAQANKVEVTLLSVTASRCVVANFEPDEASPNYGSGFLIERSTDADGTDNGTGWGLLAWGYGMTSNGIGGQYLEFSGGAGTSDATGAIQMLRVARIRQSVNKPVVFPHHWSGITTMPVSRDVLVTPWHNAHFGTKHTLSHMGSDRTYVSVYGFTTTAVYWGYALGTYDHLSLLVRYE